MRVGIFGGTFDPIHNGHLIVANDSRHHLHLDKLILVVAKDPYQKTVNATATQRYEMAVLGTKDDPLEVSRVELDRDGPTYTVDTLEELKPLGDLYLIVGSDQADNLLTWKDPDRIANLAEIWVADRWHGVSSTEVRRRVKERQPLKHFVPDAVIDYISTEGLYL